MVRLIVLPLSAACVGGFFLLYGTLLAWRPDLFLKFHDTFVDRSCGNKSAEWRNRIYGRDYTFLGVTFAIVGLIVMLAMLMRLLAGIGHGGS
jgi:hypothetical protein